MPTTSVERLLEQNPDIHTVKIDIEGAEEDVLKQDIDWGVCERLCFEYTVTSESATELQAALQAARWDTKIWMPSVFQAFAHRPSNIAPRDPGSGRGKVGHPNGATSPKGPFYYRASRTGPVGSGP